LPAPRLRGTRACSLLLQAMATKTREEVASTGEITELDYALLRRLSLALKCAPVQHCSLHARRVFRIYQV
jgi:hypothetical protein